MDPNYQPDDQFNKEPQVIKPEAMFNPSVPPHKPAPPPPPPQNTPSFSPEADAERRKKIIIVASVVLGVIVLILIAIVVLSSGGKPAKQAAGQNEQTPGILKEPSSLDVENANNSILSNITSLNDDNDFPQANLTDTNLRL